MPSLPALHLTAIPSAQQRAAEAWLPGATPRALTPLPLSLPWCVPLWTGGVPGTPRCSPVQLYSWHPPRWFKCLQGLWLDQLLDPSKEASTARGPHLKGGAEPRGGDLRLGQLQERKAEKLLSGWSPVHEGSEKENPVRTEPALGRNQGLPGLLLLLWAEGLCPQEIKLVLRGWHHYSHPYQLQGQHTRGEQRRTVLCAPSKKRGKTMMGSPFRPR